MKQSKKTSKKETIPQWWAGLTIRERNYVKAFTDGLSKSYLDKANSYLEAGYKAGVDNNDTRQKARKLHDRGRIQRSILLFQRTLWERLEVGRESTLQKLVDTYDRAVRNKDGSSQVQCVKLMMQYNQMLSINLNIDIEYQQRLDAKIEIESRALGSARLADIMAQSAGVAVAGDLPDIGPVAGLDASGGVLGALTGPSAVDSILQSIAADDAENFDSE